MIFRRFSSTMSGDSLLISAMSDRLKVATHRYVVLLAVVQGVVDAHERGVFAQVQPVQRLGINFSVERDEE